MVVAQLAGIALFTAHWGLDLYGEWLILAAIPAYLTASDLGFVTASINEMAMSVGRGDSAQAAAVLRAVSLLLMVVAVGVGALALPACLLLPLDDWLNLDQIDSATVTLVLLVLAADVVAALYGRLLYGVLASQGLYAQGSNWITAIIVAQTTAIAAVLILGGGPGAVAVAMLTARVLTTTAIYVFVRRQVPWVAAPDAAPAGARTVLRPLLAPSLASGALPLGYALNLQGVLILVGVVSGSAAAAVFATLRTVSRLLYTLLSALIAVISPEIARAFAAGDVALVRRLHRGAVQLAVWAAAAALAFLAAFGSPMIELWTSGRIDSGGTLFLLFLVGAGVNALWFTSSTVLVATNRHGPLAVRYLAICVLTLPAAYALLELVGSEGAAIALIGTELAMAVVVLRRALPAVSDTFGGLVMSLRPPTPAAVRSLVRSG
ncbi:hypothetical protein DSM112329_03001 [Paraconexibacter sp. AEG42_29]|uniref:Polysaccharide biosynthesis protein C-terminal domain-containing protein n=2 Tax=Paraconexibacter sp. AEG42_29 TaxID=2997339 RepID=A0AAU7AWQ6_9ACTN